MVSRMRFGVGLIWMLLVLGVRTVGLAGVHAHGGPFSAVRFLGWLNWIVPGGLMSCLADFGCQELFGGFETAVAGVRVGANGVWVDRIVHSPAALIVWGVRGGSPAAFPFDIRLCRRGLFGDGSGHYRMRDLMRGFGDLTDSQVQGWYPAFLSDRQSDVRLHAFRRLSGGMRSGFAMGSTTVWEPPGRLLSSESARLGVTGPEHNRTNKACRDLSPDSIRPRVFLLDPEHLGSVRLRLKQGDMGLKPAFNRLKSEADAALAAGPFSVMHKKQVPPSGDKHDYMSLAPYYWPNPEAPNGLPYVRRDGRRNPETSTISDRRELGELADAVETLALAYYLSGDERYATRAAYLVRVWFLDPETRMNPHLKFAQAIRGVNQGRGTGIIETRLLTRVVDAVGLLAGSEAWTEADQRGLTDWFAQYLDWLLTSSHGQQEAAARNNHGTYYDLQVAVFALFVGRTNVAVSVLQGVGPKRIAAQIGPDGRQPYELARTNAWGYSVGNLTGLMLLANVGEKVGVDLWHYRTPDGRSIRAALDFLVPYGFGEKQWPYSPSMTGRRGGLYPLLKRAARVWPDGRYSEYLARIPRAGDDRINLLLPEVGAPVRDLQ